MNNLDALRGRAEALHLNGLLAHWTHVAKESWVQTLIDWEEQERARRSLERRLRAARIGRFKPICDFDWNWPKRCDRTAFEALMSLDFLKDATNVVLVGPNGVGKSTLARNIAYQALLQGPHRTVHKRWPAPRRPRRTRQRFRPPPAVTQLRPPWLARHR